MRKKEGKWNTLDGVLNESWKMLSRGAAHFNDPFHWPVLGTTAKEGASLRCVILREFLLPDRILVCHSDARAEKVTGNIRFGQSQLAVLSSPKKSSVANIRARHLTCR